jgi:hypothetical protein
MRLQYDVIDHMPHVRGQFGCAEVRVWPVTFGANEKGGMDSEVFEKYIMNSIVPLYPHARNLRDKRVMLKVDSGPGRMNLYHLARLRHLGFLLYPCVPNTTHVTQETHQLHSSWRTSILYARHDCKRMCLCHSSLSSWDCLCSEALTLRLHATLKFLCLRKHFRTRNVY